MSNNFEKAFIELIGIEGGYVDDPTDRGGETKYGISKRSYPFEDIKNLTLDRAKHIYYRDFWNQYLLRLDRFEDYSIALEIFDTAVNSGQVTAARIFQKSLNILNRNERNFKDLKVDGWIGNNSFKAYNKVDNKILLKVLNGYQFMLYENFARNNPEQERFFNGWMKRIKL